MRDLIINKKNDLVEEIAYLNEAIEKANAKLEILEELLKELDEQETKEVEAQETILENNLI